MSPFSSTEAVIQEYDTESVHNIGSEASASRYALKVRVIFVIDQQHTTKLPILL